MRLSSSSIFGLLCAAAASVFGSDFTLKSYDTPSYIEFAQARFEVSEGETNAVITVVRGGDFRRIAAVDFSTRAGTAVADEDFQAAGGRLVFQAGQSFREIRIPILQDDAVEGDETLIVELSNPGAYTEIVAPSAEVVIKDEAPAPTLDIARAEGEVVISWPQTAAAYQLQVRDFTTAWQNVALSAEPGENKWVVRIPPNANYNLFRLVAAE